MSLSLNRASYQLSDQSPMQHLHSEVNNKLAVSLHTGYAEKLSIAHVSKLRWMKIDKIEMLPFFFLSNWRNLLRVRVGDKQKPIKNSEECVFQPPHISHTSPKQAESIIERIMKHISEIYDHLRAFAKFSVMRLCGISHSHKYFYCIADTPVT